MNYVLDARTATSHFPGIGRYVFNLAQAIVPMLRQEERLILLRDPTQATPWNLSERAGAQVTIVDVPSSPFSLVQQWQIPRLLRRLKADLYHSPYYLMPYRPGLPTLLTVYDLIPLRYPHYVSMRARLIFRWATALALRAATGITTISDATRQDLLAIYPVPSTKVTTILLAADPRFGAVSGDSLAALRERLDLPEDYVLYLGSNKPHKNLLRLLQAWVRLQPQPMPLLIAGVWDERYRDIYRQAAALGLDQDSLLILGPVAEQDLPGLYSGATMFVFPSEYEGFGLPVLEAMACGTPVACARAASLPEVAGDAALHFDPGDVEAMADVIGGLISDPDLQANLRRRGFQRNAHFSWAKTAQQTLDLYRAVL